jgi:hypothetical protein
MILNDFLDLMSKEMANAPAGTMAAQLAEQVALANLNEDEFNTLESEVLKDPMLSMVDGLYDKLALAYSQKFQPKPKTQSVMGISSAVMDAIFDEFNGKRKPYNAIKLENGTFCTVGLNGIPTEVMVAKPKTAYPQESTFIVTGKLEGITSSTKWGQNEKSKTPTTAVATIKWVGGEMPVIFPLINEGRQLQSMLGLEQEITNPEELLQELIKWAKDKTHVSVSCTAYLPNTAFYIRGYYDVDNKGNFKPNPGLVKCLHPGAGIISNSVSLKVAEEPAENNRGNMEALHFQDKIRKHNERLENLLAMNEERESVLSTIREEPELEAASLRLFELQQARQEELVKWAKKIS